jgi:putative flippase GtrA
VSASTLNDGAANRDRLARVVGALAGERRQLLLFLAVGILNTVVGYCLFAVLYLTLQSYRVAAVLAFASGVLFNFFSTGRWVFESRSLRALIPFVVGYLAILGLNLLLLEVLVAWGMNALLAQALSLPPMVIASYLINSRIVFRR